MLYDIGNHSMSNQQYIIGKVIKYFRNKRGLSQEALAKDICNKDHLYTIERGNHDPSPALLEQLSLRLGVNLFDYRYFVSLHGSFECHEKCTKLSSLVSDENITELDKYIDKYKNDPDFSSGEPLLLLFDLVEVLENKTGDEKLDLEQRLQDIIDELTTHRIGLLKIGNYNSSTGEIELIADATVVDDLSYDEHTGEIKISY